MRTKVFNLIVLDESGSMSCIERQAIDGVNETVNTIKDAQKRHEDQEHYVTLVSFDSRRLNRIYEEVPVQEVRAMTQADYQPCACTPLYDALGESLTKLRGKVGAQDMVLVTIITDGYENASREWTGKAVKALIDELKEHEWVFTYIGANQDVEKVAESMGVANYMAFNETESGTRKMFERENASRSVFFDKMSNAFSCNFSEDVVVDDSDEGIRYKKARQSLLNNFFNE